MKKGTRMNNVINKFIESYENVFAKNISPDDESAKEEYDRIYQDNRSQGFIAGHILSRKQPKRLTMSQKLMLLNILSNYGADIDIFMTYEDILKMKESIKKDI